MAKMTKEMAQQIQAANAEPDEHVCTPETCPDGNYYVSCADGPEFWLMAGPYPTHAAALADVRRARDIANEIDGRSHFMAWGTVNMKSECTRPGRLNELNLFNPPLPR